MIRHPYSLLILFSLLAVLILGACNPQSGPPPAAEEIVLHDGLGREISLEVPVERIVSLAPSNTEILYAIGAGDKVVGRDEFSDYPPEVSSLPSVGGSFTAYNYEAIVDLQPDLVLAAEINTAEQVQALEDLGLQVYWLANPTSLEEMYANLLTLAALTGNEGQASALVEDLKTRVANVEQIIASAAETPKVFYELDSTDPNAPWTAGSGTFIDTLISMSGGQNVVSHLEGQYLQISVEELVVQNPEIILLGDAAYGVSAESVAARPGWDGIDAVRNGRVYAFDDNLVSRPGPRLVEGLEILARLLHPGLSE